MPKYKEGVDVLTSAKERVKIAFNNFEKICVSYSGGKDSNVMLQLVLDEAIKRGRKVAVLFIDLEAQYDLTIKSVEKMFEDFAEHIEPYWVCLPIHLRNAVSVYEPFWLCWDESVKHMWVRNPPKMAISDTSHFPFFNSGMEFEEFVPEFAEWYSDGVPSAFFVGIRSDESYSRYMTITSNQKKKFCGFRYTTGVCDSSDSYNFYPLYDWTTEDIWTFSSRPESKIQNEIYDRMQMAGVPISQQRLCQPYGDDQRRGLWLFHLLEPTTWPKVVARVTGANSGALYCEESGNVNGYRNIYKPVGITWKQFAENLVSSMPKKSKDHYEEKIGIFIRWWLERGYENGVPDEIDHELEVQKKAPSWRRVCKSILRNDYWCKGLGFTQPKSDAYKEYLSSKEKTNKKKNKTVEIKYDDLGHGLLF